MTRSHRGILRRMALVALAAPLVAACSLNDQKMGVAGPPSPGGSLFASYVALGTSIGAGFQSGGINDSTQRQSYAVLLAQAAGLSVGQNWFYPSFQMPGCPAPFSNTLTQARVGNPTKPCYTRTASSVAPFENNLGVPGLRLAQVMNIDTVPFGVTDTLQLSQFITGGRSPIQLVAAQHATFVTWETFANDVLGAATHGDTTLLTPLASFTAYLGAVANALDSAGVKGVAIINVPNVTVIPYFSAGVVFFCLHTGAPGCPVGATAPYSSANFTVDLSCAPSAAGGVGDSMLVGFPATAKITATLAGGGAASLNCGAGTASTTPGGATGPVLSKATTIAIATRVAQMNGALQQVATNHGYAIVDANAILAAKVATGDIPPFPNFNNPAHLFGPVPPLTGTAGHPDLISYDGIHPTGAAHIAIADALVAAINAKYQTQLVAP